MATDRPTIPRRFAIARRWQWPAAIGAGLFVVSCFVGWPLGHYWPSVAGLAFFIPAAWLFSIRCDVCGFPAFADHKDEQRLAQDTRWLTRIGGKEHGGVHLPLRDQCSKCGARFV